MFGVKWTFPFSAFVPPHAGSMFPAPQDRQPDSDRNALAARSPTLLPERGCPHPQQQRARSAARVFGTPTLCGRAAAQDRRPLAMPRKPGAVAGSACASAAKSCCACSAAAVTPCGRGKRGPRWCLRVVFPSSILPAKATLKPAKSHHSAWCQRAGRVQAGCCSLGFR